jgi:hypothetical protein
VCIYVQSDNFLNKHSRNTAAAEGAISRRFCIKGWTCSFHALAPKQKSNPLGSHVLSLGVLQPAEGTRLHEQLV